MRGDDGSYYISDKDEPRRVLLQLVKSMVRRLHAEAERYYSAYAGKPTNYEDIYYLARQASDELLGEMENPAIRVFVNELKADVSPLVQAANEQNEDPNEPYEPHVPNDLTKLLEETCKYIADVVSKSLLSYHPTPTSTGQLKIIEHACNSANVTSISTLCHDTHIETFLRAKAIALSDGFDEERKNGVRYWNNELSSYEKTPFLKLHGSLDWFEYPLGIGIPPADSYPMRTQTPDGSWQYAYPSQATVPPLLLIGTFNKISHYSSGIFHDLHYRFRSTISKASTMVICGYSFGDKGINTEIVDWILGQPGRRFVIIHPDPNTLVANARGVIQNNWNEWKKNGSIKVIPKRFECVDIDEFEKAIYP